MFNNFKANIGIKYHSNKIMRALSVRQKRYKNITYTQVNVKFLKFKRHDKNHRINSFSYLCRLNVLSAYFVLNHHVDFKY